MTWAINNEIRPLRRGDVQTAMDIVEGGSLAAPVYLGTLDIARNTNEIAAHLGFPLVNQVGASSWTYGGAVEKFAAYMVQPPGIRMNSSGYTVLRIDVTATTTGGTTFAVRGVTSVETGATSSPTASTATATCYVQIQPGIDMASEDGSGDTLRLLELDYELSGAGTFSPTRIIVTPAWSSESYASDAAAFETDTVFPQDDEAWSVDAPLNVHSVRELVVANNYMYAHSHRHVVAWCFMNRLDALTTADAGIIGTGSSDVNLPVATYLYWPRPGVRRLSVSATGRVDHASNTSTMAVSWRGGGQKVTATLPANTTNWTTWPLLNELLEVPNGQGPHEILVYINRTSQTYIQGLSIIEVVDRAVNSDYIGGI